MLESLAYAIGGVLMDTQPGEALTAFQAFERWAVSELGEDHPAVVQAVARQGWCQSRLGRRAEACALYERALQILRPLVEEGHPACGEIQEYLSTNCGTAARLEAGETPGELSGPQTLTGLPRFNPFGADVAWSGSLEALEAQVRAAARQLGVVDPYSGPREEVETQGYNVGAFFREIGDFENAARMYGEYARWATENYGPDHDFVLQALHQLAYCHWQLGDFTEGCRLYQRTIEILRKTAPENPYIRVLEQGIEGKCPAMPEKLLYGLADQLDEADRLEEAAAALEAYERWAVREYGDEHLHVLGSRIMRASCYERLGEYHDACRLYRQVLVSAPRLGVDGEVIVGIKEFVSERCDSPPEDSGDPGALPPLPLGERWMSPPLAEIEPDLESIGEFLIEEEHYEEAISAFEGAQAWLDRVEGPDSPSTALLLAKRAWCHVKIGDHELACRLYERAIRLEQASEEPNQDMLRSASEYLEENCR
ncbi:MAG: tetratricopeptide repeat protein [Candidatus Dormibacteraeota bacterium]|nr:tetratricopeptide repeat protein [Candidatus Dormibacteraeota bacterium]